MRTRNLLLSLCVATAACSDIAASGGAPAQIAFEVQSEIRLGDNSNPEVVAWVPGTHRVLIVSSKSRELTLLDTGQGTGSASGELSILRSRSLLPDDASESELTHAVVHASGDWAAVTRTLVEQDESGARSFCGGELLLVSVRDDGSFGDLIRRIEVGPMPDAVAIAPGGGLLAVANERDVVWGKCESVAGVAPPSISLISTEDGPAAASEVVRVEMTSNLEREPEQLAFSSDGATLAVTLQDSHEVGFLDVGEAVAGRATSDANLVIVRLAQNALGQDPWPDGVVTFEHPAEGNIIAVAAEASDEIHFLSMNGPSSLGVVVSAASISTADLPAHYPRDGSWGPLFQPDSLTAFQTGEASYLAVSLKSAGAIGVWDISDLSQPRFHSAMKLGLDEAGGPDEVSTVLTEGIAVSVGSEQEIRLVAANEGDGTVSLVTSR